QDPLLVSFKKNAGSSWLSSQLSNARGNIHAHVGKPIEVLCHTGQVFGEVSRMQHAKLGLGMPCQNPVSGLKKLCVAGKVAAVKRPIWMVRQFLVPFIESVGRGEKWARIGHM